MKSGALSVRRGILRGRCRQENVDALERAVAATNRGDVEAVLTELHPEVEFHAFMEELLGGEGRVYWGHAGVREFFRDFNESFDQLHWEYPDIRDLGDRVLAGFRHLSAPVAARVVPRQ